MPPKRLSITFLVILVLMFPAFWELHYDLGRPDLDGTFMGTEWIFLAFHGILLILYGAAVLRGNDRLHTNIGIGAGVLLRAMLIFSVPAYSDDFYRFIWDGHVALAGFNPFHFTPSELMQQSGVEIGQTARDVYDQLNSKGYHSVYPPVLQGAFRLAAYLGGSPFGTMVVLKGMVVLAEMLSMFFIFRIIRRFQLPLRSNLVYALNPLVIFELSGNLHFEAFMICFLLGAIWMLMLSRPVTASAFFAFAIGSKILPLMAFPFLIRRLGWGRSLVIGLLTAAIFAGMGYFYFDETALVNFRASLGLYFQHFEFNGGVYYLVKSALGDHYFWAQRLLPVAVFVVVILSSWLERDRIWKGYASAVMLALAIYQFASPVVHPWYVTPIVALCVLGPYRFPVVWTALLPLTYLAYRGGPGAPVEEQAWVLWLEYGVLFVFLAYEAVFVRRRKTLEEWMHDIPALRSWLQKTIPARLAIKLHRIMPLLPKDAPILDLGTGNGSLCKALRENGFQVQPLDVKDISFFPEVKPMIYDGKMIPFEAGHFDTTMIITVLHHIADPDKVLDEAIRVTSRRIVVMEDIYRNPFQKYLTYFTDSLVNMEFVGHPHTNRSDRGWKRTFAQKGLKIVQEDEFRTLLFYRQKIYVLEKA